MIGCDFSSFQSVRIIIRTHCFLWMFLFKKTDIVLLFVHLVLFCWNWYRHASQRYSNLDEVRHSTSEFKSSSSEKESFVVKGCHRARLKIKQQKKRSWAFFFLSFFCANESARVSVYEREKNARSTNFPFCWVVHNSHYSLPKWQFWAHMSSLASHTRNYHAAAERLSMRFSVDVLMRALYGRKTGCITFISIYWIVSKMSRKKKLEFVRETFDVDHTCVNSQQFNHRRKFEVTNIVSTNRSVATKFVIGYRHLFWLILAKDTTL